MKNQTRLVNVQGVPMRIHGSPECVSDGIARSQNFWEYPIFNEWYHHFPSDGLMLDIGANIGSHCLQFNKHFPNLNIWAFEIHPTNFELLKENTLSYNKIYCFNVGVGSCNNIVHYNNGPQDNSGGVAICHNGENVNLVVALDSFMIPQPVKFIKIDIEGHELSAFEGMKDLILKDKPLIWLEDFNGRATKFLTNLGYEMVEKIDATSDFLMENKN